LIMKIPFKNFNKNSPEKGAPAVVNGQWSMVNGLAAILFVLCALSFTSFSLINSFDTKANSMAVDNFGSFYTASDHAVLKFSSDGKFQNRYEEFKYGKIGMIDVSNPMKMLVFYPDFMTVVTLDRFLAPLNTYNFFQLGY